MIFFDPDKSERFRWFRSIFITTTEAKLFAEHALTQSETQVFDKWCFFAVGNCNGYKRPYGII